MEQLWGLLGWTEPATTSQQRRGYRLFASLDNHFFLSNLSEMSLLYTRCQGVTFTVAISWSAYLVFSMF